MFKLKSFSKEREATLGFSIMNPYDVDEGNDDHCLYNFVIAGRSWWYKGPRVFKPASYPRTYQHEGKTRSYEQLWPKQYGFMMTEEALHVYYGQQTHSWGNSEESTKSKCFFIPWNQWRRTRYDFLNGQHECVCSANDFKSGRIDFDAIRRAEEIVPKINFQIVDFDDEVVNAEAYITESRYDRGDGWFKWLKFFCAARIYRKLDFTFDKEVGERKGSWKGGLISTSCEIKPGESAIEAFTRWSKSDSRDGSGIKEVRPV